MGVIDAFKAWLTPLPAMDERAVLPPPLPYLDNYLPYATMPGGLTYGIGPILQQTLLGNDESVSGDFSGITLGAFAGNAAVFAVERKRVDLFKQARPMWRQLRSGRPGELFSTPALDILRTPWPGGTTADLLSAMTLSGDLGGMAFVVRRPKHLAVLRPDWVTIIHGSPRDTDSMWDADAEVLGIAYQPGGPSGGRNPVFYLREEVAIFVAMKDPLAPTRGISWMRPILREVASHSAGTSHRLAFYRNGATPNLVVTGVTPGAGQSLQDWIDKFNAKNSGVANAYKTLFFNQGVDAKVVGSSLEQLDLKVTQGMSETLIAAAAGVPAVVAQLSEGLQGSSLNAGNYSQAFRLFADLTARPWWADAFASLATIVPPPPGAELYYDDSDIPALKDDVKDAAEVLAAKAQAARTLTDSGWDPDAVIDAVVTNDLKRLRGKHTGLFSVQLQPPMPEGPEPEPEPEEPTDEEPTDE